MKPVLHISQSWSRAYHKKENYRPIFLMEIDTNFLKKSCKPFSIIYQKIIYHDHVCFITGMQG
jgi:hypothetical protein